ncbi:hypothetical protein E1301_Tti019575 [Triplophysa tibetana]|uniref:Uncharacterized protein n=1 Tax=Triplophysa tibetana TaxID=1572043 RepID=A0A5A9P0N0_9TELE|nr:hypothetical protein E1301_Tti019575 [Triplophysa tibetana]
MGCTVSFICCEEDFLQMPFDQHVEKKKENGLLSKASKEAAFPPLRRRSVIPHTAARAFVRSQSDCAGHNGFLSEKHNQSDCLGY